MKISEKERAGGMKHPSMSGVANLSFMAWARSPSVSGMPGSVRCALVHVDELVVVSGRQAEQQESFEPPIREIDEIPAGRVLGRQDIAKVIPGQQKRLDPAKRAGEEPVGFLQVRRGPALRALVFDLKGGQR